MAMKIKQMEKDRIIMTEKVCTKLPVYHAIEYYYNISKLVFTKEKNLILK